MPAAALAHFIVTFCPLAHFHNSSFINVNAALDQGLGDFEA